MKKGLKKGIVFFSAAILIAVIACCIHIQDKDPMETVSFQTSASDGITQSIRPYYDENSGKHYVFLPSYADLDTLSIRYNAAAYTCALDGKDYDRNSSLSDIQTNREYLFEIRNLFGKTLCRTGLIFMKGGHIPALSISLSEGTLHDIESDKNTSSPGWAVIVREDQTIDFSGYFREMHGRGYMSWKQSKKSFTINFSESTKLLGMEAGKGWVLTANSFDESSLRNKLVYDTAKEIGVDFAVDSRYVDLYIDNNYQGLYLLTEKIETEEGRVNIDNLAERTQALNQKQLSTYPRFEEKENQKIKRGYEIPHNPEDITGGYLLEIIFGNRQGNYASLVSTEELLFSLVSPKYASREQIAYLSGYLNTVEDRLRRNDLSDLDLPSFAKYYLIQELFANWDKVSVFFYKEPDQTDGRLHACCIWDFDLSIGNSWLESDMNPRFLYQNRGNWFNYLLQNEQFVSMVRQYYETDIRPQIAELIDNRLDEYEKLIDDSFQMDKTRWRINADDKYKADQSQNRFDTLQEHVDTIKDYMKQRTDFLDSVWTNQEEYYFITFESGENNSFRNDTFVFRKCYSVKKGEALNENPVPESDGSYRFTGWLDADGNEYVPGRVPEHDEYWSAKWEVPKKETKEENTQEQEAEAASPAEEKESLRTRLEDIWWSYSEEQHIKIAGLGIISCLIFLFVVSDRINSRKSRRADREQK